MHDHQNTLACNRSKKIRERDEKTCRTTTKQSVVSCWILTVFCVCVCWFSFNQSGKVLPLYRNILHIYYRVYRFRNSVFGDSVPVDRYDQDRDRKRRRLCGQVFDQVSFVIFFYGELVNYRYFLFAFVCALYHHQAQDNLREIKNKT